MYRKGRQSFVVLGKAMHDSTGLLLSMLVGNNLTHYIVTSIVTFLLLSKVEVTHTAELFATLITVPILFVFSEIIPKNLFFYRADYLMPYVAPVLYFFHKLFSWCGAVPLLKSLSGIFSKLTGSETGSKTMMTEVQRHHVRAIFADTREEGLLSSVQSDIINRLVGISHVSITSVMVPAKNIQMVDVNSDRSVLLNTLKKSGFTRLLVIEGAAENIIGFINIYEILTSSEEFSDLRKYINPIQKLSADTTVIDAINFMQKKNQKIVLVMRFSRGRERPLGIVTMKDLVEELIGELSEW